MHYDIQPECRNEALQRLDYFCCERTKLLVLPDHSHQGQREVYKYVRQ